MPFNVLLLPLLGGYVFVSKWNYTRFDTKRHSGERLIIFSALAGVVFLVAAYAACHAVAYVWPKAFVVWHGLVPYEHAGTSLVAFCFGCLAWWPLNRYLNHFETEVTRAISERHDYLEMLLHHAAKQNRQVALTLERGKVYVGFVVALFDPSYDRRFVTILPTLSGYRNSETHELRFTTDYTAVYQQLIADEQERIVTGVEDFEVVLPVSKVISAANFDPTLFGRFNPGHTGPTGEGEHTGRRSATH